ncbi:hypothetical protein LIER_36157 [Lithospermum erythrorhizon]|uniref:Uncharacterized protein n=1 Tax=Lithospermum erythrorhizon TaxID=34254 RepID=A0AAV3P4G0_LITER
MREVQDQGKYIGLPSYIGRSKKEVFGYLLTKVDEHIKRWKGKLLSQARMSSDKERGIHWKSWSYQCEEKFEGGLGFKDLGCMNLALLAKQGWRVTTKQASLLAKLLKRRYYRRSTFLHAKLRSNPSFGWRSLLEGWRILCAGVR